jgi:hypothetical protein
VNRFALWESDELVTDYSTRCVASPPLLILGFAIPRFRSKADPYAIAVEQAMLALVDMKRDDDPFRLERYVLETPSSEELEQSGHLGREESPQMAAHKKAHRGFLLDPEFIRTTIRDPGRRDTAARDVAGAIEKLVDVTSRLSGPRHIFVYFNPADDAGAALGRLAKSLRTEAVILHGFAPEGQGEYENLRDLCLTNAGGSFHSLPLDGLQRVLEETYLGLIDRYEIVYRTDAAPGSCKLHVRTPVGCGEATVDFGSR